MLPSHRKYLFVGRRFGEAGLLHGWMPLAGAIGLALAAAAAAADQNPVGIAKGPGTITVLWAGQPLARYQSDPHPNKPYLESLFSPAGLNVLRDSPADHKHHHGLMFAVAVEGVDFWSETPTCGRQVDRDTAAVVRPGKDGPAAPGSTAAAILTQRLAWLSPGGTPLLEETRTLEITRLAADPATLLVWQSRLAVPPGRPSSKLSGSAYFGLGMRFALSMDRGGQLLNAQGHTGQTQTNNVRAAWTAYTAAVDGKPVTVAMFDLAGNPRPATWFTMEQPFAYLSATLGLHEKPLDIPAAEPLELRYGVAVWDGKVSPSAIDEVYKLLLVGHPAADGRGRQKP